MTDSASGPTISTAAPPYVDCIQWIPRRFAAGSSPVTIVDLIFRPEILAEISARVAAEPVASAFGLLMGRVFEDPTCDRRWGRLDRVVPCEQAPHEDAGPEALAAAIEAIAPGTGNDGSVALGWYRSHVATGLYLSPEEARFHEERFPEPWGFALILAGAPERRSGGIFQRTAPEGLSRSAYMPFYELSPAAREPALRPTVVSWPNYQTESRVAFSPGAAEGAAPNAHGRAAAKETRTVATIPELGSTGDAGSTADARPAGGSESAPVPEGRDGGDAGDDREPAGPTGAPSKPKRAIDPLSVREETDADWEKVQIQRSLTAVGRTLGPSTIGELGAPERAGPPAIDEPVPGAEEELAVPPAPVPMSDPAPEPIRGLPDENTVGLVGRARRRRGLPVRRIALAAAGFVLMAAAGWVGTRMLADPAEEDGAGAASAGVGLAPGELFGASDPGTPSDDAAQGRVGLDRENSPDAALAAGPGLDSAQARSAAVAQASTAADIDDPGADAIDAGGLDPPGADAGPAAGTDVTGATAGSEAAAGSAAAEDGGAPPIEVPRPPGIIEAPDPSSVILDDPGVSAYENALSIFRAELERYETTRDEFDEGLATCNPLNLSYRGVVDAHSRLQRRHQEAGARLSDATTQAHRVAEREFAIAKTHYELTDCPMPIGN